MGQLEEGKLYRVRYYGVLEFKGKNKLGTKTGILRNDDIVMFCGYTEDYADGILLASNGNLYSFVFESAVDLHQEDLFQEVPRKTR